jgi:hypothetical protein
MKHPNTPVISSRSRLIGQTRPHSHGAEKGLAAIAEMQMGVGKPGGEVITCGLLLIHLANTFHLRNLRFKNPGFVQRHSIMPLG